MLNLNHFDPRDLPAGTTIEYEVAGYSGDVARYKFYANGRDITRLVAAVEGSVTNQVGTVGLPPSEAGAGRSAVGRLSRRLYGSEDALRAYQLTSVRQSAPLIRPLRENPWEARSASLFSFF